jgi:hypothetical protein
MMNGTIQSLLAHPAVQGGVAPFLVGALVAALAQPLRLAKLAPAAGFMAAVYLVGNFAFEPLTATRKIVLLAAAAPVAGLIVDLAFRPARGSGIMLGAIFGVAALWAFWTVLGQRPLPQAVLHGTGIVALVVLIVALTTALRADPVRAGAVGLGLGLGVGAGAILGASALIGQYGTALGAAAGGYVLLVTILGRRVAAGATFTLSVSVPAALLALGAVLLAEFPWYAALTLALAPVAVRLPLPRRAHPAAQAMVASAYSLAVATAACMLAWTASRM